MTVAPMIITLGAAVLAAAVGLLLRHGRRDPLPAVLVAGVFLASGLVAVVFGRIVPGVILLASAAVVAHRGVIAR